MANKRPKPEEIVTNLKFGGITLWLEVDWSSTAVTFTFAWPGLGEHSDKTTTYFNLVLDAYGGQKPGLLH